MLSEEFYKRMCDQASIGVIILDVDFRITMMNPMAAQLFEVKVDDVQDKQADCLVVEKRREATIKLLNRAVSQKRSLEYRFHRGSGKDRRYLIIKIDPICKSDNGGETVVDGICLWVRDLTKRMELEKRLAEIEKLASLGHLAGGLAHHFNNILGGIVTAVDHALCMDDPITSHRTLVMIQDGLVNAVDLTRRLLDFSTPDLPDRNLADLTEVVLNFIEDAEHATYGAPVTINIEMQEIPILAVHADKLRHVLDALLANSVEAMGSCGGEISLALKTDDHNIYLEFKDTGTPIPVNLLDRIFDPFFTTRGALGGGTAGNLGLGLTVARRLTEELGASLSYDVEKSQNGSCFVLSFAMPKKDFHEN